MKVTTKINQKHFSYMKKICTEALVETADAIRDDLVKSKTMPFDNGELQDRRTFIDDSKKNSGVVRIVSDTPYARRLYFHPEYNFKKDKNSNAGGMWFQPYINGNKKDYGTKAYARILRGKM